MWMKVGKALEKTEGALKRSESGKAKGRGWKMHIQLLFMEGVDDSIFHQNVHELMWLGLWGVNSKELLKCSLMIQYRPRRIDNASRSCYFTHPRATAIIVAKTHLRDQFWRLWSQAFRTQFSKSYQHLSEA